MQGLTQPTLLLKRFCESGTKNTIPDVNTDSGNPQKADLTNGFPVMTQGSPDDGKLPPERADFNGLGYLTTSYDFFYQAGGTFTFSPTISTAIGGYPLGARLWHTNSGGVSMILRSTKDDNTDDFTQDESYIGTSWVIESMVGIDNSSINLLDYKFSDKLINKMSWVLSNGSWLSGATYTSVMTHLKEDVAFMPTDTPSIVVSSNSKFSSGTYTRSSGDDKVVSGVSYYAWNNGTDTFYVLVDIDAMSGADAFVALQGQSIFEYDNPNMYLTVHKIVKIEKETVDNGGTDIDLYVWIGSDGHRIVDVTGGTDQDTAVGAIYSQTGVAWFYVLDVANNRFKLPRENTSRLGLPQSIAISGNGKSMGLTDGTNGLGLVGDWGSYQVQNSAWAYDVNVGTTGTGGAHAGIVAMGMTTDATKSGVVGRPELSDNAYDGRKYLYFYVGGFNDSAVSQTAGINANVINSKMDVDCGNSSDDAFANLIFNASSASKEALIGLNAPKMSSALSIVSPYTPAVDGWVFYSMASNGNGCYLEIDGVEICRNAGAPGGWVDSVHAQVLVKAGQTITFTVGSSGYCSFAPCL